jgi:AraC family transcriptional regulator of adaptative response/methylated-DNA-[protein]-cysteine methyltransferase
MNALPTNTLLSTRARFSNEADRWQAVVARDPEADGQFLYSVATTGIYCRPVCSARLALRKNVCFHNSCQDAERAGFRPCKRCQPNGKSRAERDAAIVAEACRMITQTNESLSLDNLADAAGLSRHHFHRMFKAQTGVTPKAFTIAHRNQRVKQEIVQQPTITKAIYGAGFAANSRFYESATAVLGMSPKVFKAGGAGTSIRFATGQCSLGKILVAASDKGVCCIMLGDDAGALAGELQSRFPNAELIGGDQPFEELIATVIQFVEHPSQGLNLPLDIRGTAFQQQVWQALQQIPVGSTASYAQIAQQIGKPKSMRAVAQACAANPIAVAVPCHRVIRTDGSLSGYRWGVERKSELLRRESENA